MLATAKPPDIALGSLSDTLAALRVNAEISLAPAEALVGLAAVAHLEELSLAGVAPTPGAGCFDVG